MAPPRDEDDAVSVSSGKRLVHTSDKEFQSLAISEPSKRALAEVFKYQFMTVVQAETLPVILAGRDCLAKAKTGTGKTLAFLIPAIEKLPGWRASETQRHIPILVLSPNRELAAQIGAEAEQLLRFHPNKRVVCVVGGTNINTEKNSLDRGNVAVLVATPGRLIDHFESTRGFQQSLSGISTFVLDEADQLLDMGFKPALDRILGFLPPSSLRQTLLFSATVPPAVKQIADVFLRRGYSYVDTVGEEAEQTHLHVQQHLTSVSMDDMNAALLSMLSQQLLTPNLKFIVFFTTARMAGFEADLFETLRLPVLQIHSRMSQNARTRTSDQFRTGTNLILFSSDVSARGLDYPDVTYVLQVGFTEKSQYIHRLGRTARAGREGSGMLLLHDFEENAMRRELSGLPLEKIDASALQMDACRARVSAALGEVGRNADLRTAAEQSYQAWLGYYNGKLRVLNWSKDTLVDRANYYSRTLGLSQIPALQKKTVGKMGLKGVAGLRIVG